MTEEPALPPAGEPGSPSFQAPTPSDPSEMSVIEHLDELRWRLIKAGGAVAVGSVGVFCVNNQVIHLLERPLDPSYGILHVASAGPVQLIFTSPAEYFLAVVKVALLGGLYLALPVVLYQGLAFVAPGLTPGERRWAIPAVIGAALRLGAGE